MSDTSTNEQKPQAAPETPQELPITPPPGTQPPPLTPTEPHQPRPETEPPAGKQTDHETLTDDDIAEYDRKARDTFGIKLQEALKQKTAETAQQSEQQHDFDPDADDPAPGSDAARLRIRDAIRQGK